MKPINISPSKGLKGSIRVPGDKSVSHRALMLASISEGKTVIKNFLFSEDCIATLEVLKNCGVKVVSNKTRNEVIVFSKGNLKNPKKPLFVNESGTSARLFLGLLAGQGVDAVLTGAQSLLKRPMDRVIEPLVLMGAIIRPKGKKGFLPLEIISSDLNGIFWKQKIASAQVKSAILLAGLRAEGETIIEENRATRDHTERMLDFFGADIRIKDKRIVLSKSFLCSPKEINIPGDISSAAFFIVAGLVTKNSKLIIRDVGINPTRTGMLNVLERMGANIKIMNIRRSFEPSCDIEVKSSVLKATIIKADEIPSLIDELPVLMVAAAFARGRTVIHGIQELRVKETDRIVSLVENLTKLSVDIRVKSLKGTETVEITGSPIVGGVGLKSFSDHRTAMSMVVAALASLKGASLDDISCVNKSFPQFMSVLNQLLG